MKQVLWNKPIYDEFIRLTILTDTQKKVIDLHVKGKTLTQIAMEINLSESSVQRTIKDLKIIYDSVQPYSDILPIRKTK